jgi:hypothetical protein
MYTVQYLSPIIIRLVLLFHIKAENAGVYFLAGNLYIWGSVPGRAPRFTVQLQIQN